MNELLCRQESGVELVLQLCAKHYHFPSSVELFKCIIIHLFASVHFIFLPHRHGLHLLVVCPTLQGLHDAVLDKSGHSLGHGNSKYL